VNKPLTDDELDALEEEEDTRALILAVPGLISEVQKLRGALRALLDVTANMSSIESPQEIEELEVAEGHARRALTGEDQ
jgi:hypothetical protein